MYQATGWKRLRKVVARLECSVQPDVRDHLDRHPLGGRLPVERRIGKMIGDKRKTIGIAMNAVSFSS
jgi:hypothetical protein